MAAYAIRMWDNHTMSREVASTPADLGRRIADARTEAGTTQADLAATIGIERTAVVRIESGERKVSATEVVAIAEALDRSVDWFFTESPVAVVSRRRDPAVGGFSRALDRALESAARDVAWERERLVENELRQGELFEFGERFAVELDPPSVPPAYARAVVSAYRKGQLTAARTVELLHHSVGEADLPEPDAMSLDELRSEFQTGL